MRDSLSFQALLPLTERRQSVACSYPVQSLLGCLSLGYPLKTGFLIVFKKHQLLFLFCYLCVGYCSSFPSTCCFWMLKGFLWTSLPNPTLAAGLGRVTDWWCLRFVVLFWFEGLKSFSKHDLIPCQSVYNTVLGVSQNKACLKFMQFKKMLGNGANGALQSTCVTNVTEVEKEIVLPTFLKLLSSRSEKNPLLCWIQFSLSDYYFFLCIQNRKLSRLWNPKEIEKVSR